MRYRTTKISPRMAFRKSVITAPRDVIEIGRNDPCPCGSGKKYKSCCIEKGDHFLRKMAAKAKKEKQGGLIKRLFGTKKTEE